MIVCIEVIKTKQNKIKLSNGKLVIENEVMEIEIKVKTKYCVDIAVVDTAQKHICPILIQNA